MTGNISSRYSGTTRRSSAFRRPKPRRRSSRRRCGTCTGTIRFFLRCLAGSTAGVGLFTREQPLSIRYGFGNPVFDNKGRVLVADYGRFVLLNISFPLGIKPMGNLDNKLKFYDAFLLYVRSLCEEGRAVIICGDFNVAHTDRDLYNPPKKPVRQVGISPEERGRIDQLVGLGFTDTFRIFHEGAGHYTRWPFQNNSRERNFGWRIDYCFVSNALKPYVSDAAILPEIKGSDHCPVMLGPEPPGYRDIPATNESIVLMGGLAGTIA